MLRAHRFAWIFALALFARALIPAGWMPSPEQGEIIILCTETGATQAWIDTGGKLHKSSPMPGKAHDQPCAFSGLGMAANAFPIGPFVAIPESVTALRARPQTVTVGQGLAAPPPPSTGPPSLI